MFSLPSLDSTLGVLSAMVTPAVMILATSSLILTTTNRLVRIVDRVREMLPEFETLARSAQPDVDQPASSSCLFVEPRRIVPEQLLLSLRLQARPAEDVVD